MTYVIAQPCVDLKDRACVDECPVDCIYEGKRMLDIHPDECVDCGACEPVCPVEAIYPVIFIDAIVVKVRDGQVTNRPFYVAIGVTVDGNGTSSDCGSATAVRARKFWLQVLTEFKNRGVDDVCIVVLRRVEGSARRRSATTGRWRWCRPVCCT